MDFFVHVACIMDSSEWTFMKVNIVLNKVWAFFEDVEEKGGRLVEMWELVFIFIFLKIYFDKYLTFYLYLDIFESNMLLVFLKDYSHLSNKRGAHAYRFKKIPPSTKQKSTLHVY